MRFNTIFGLLFLVGCALGLYQVKYMVRDVKKDVASLTKHLKQEQQQMHVLDAEWAHLNRPERLEELSRGHLGLIPASVTQMQADVAVLPVRAIVPLDNGSPKALAASAPAADAPAAPLARQVSYAR